MTVRSNQLYLGAAENDAITHELYEVPAATRTIVKEIRLINGPDDVANIRMGVRFSTGGTGFTSFFYIEDVLGNTWLAFDTWQVLLPGQVLTYRGASGAANGALMVSGAELAL